MLFPKCSTVRPISGLRSASASATVNNSLLPTQYSRVPTQDVTRRHAIMTPECNLCIPNSTSSYLSCTLASNYCERSPRLNMSRCEMPTEHSLPPPDRRDSSRPYPFFEIGSKNAKAGFIVIQTLHPKLSQKWSLPSRYCPS